MEKMTEFLTITRELNKIGITPLLMGSLGLEQVTQKDWQVCDIDIHVPSDPRGWEAPDDQRIVQFDKIEALMQKLGYELYDLHEHAFQKGNFDVQFGGIDSLESFAGVSPKDLQRKQAEGANYLLPTASQFLKIYRASSQDSYRNDRKNNKDFAKIAYLEDLLQTKTPN
ncbi:hypothetical protein [Streptococcus massiliensis]|uniref:Phosphoribosylanthranilate isomerase n=1 Tax=Streptococcus massiliensis TaxID=313439 RepID=A0A380KWH3_9STRE|nr:hypothetical protein [Streptococcus massiliensis]SUN75901.1 phosphoribosylanthranilate isomerase [Streptococcus massiliensis]